MANEAKKMVRATVYFHPDVVAWLKKAAKNKSTELNPVDWKQVAREKLNESYELRRKAA